MAAQRKLGRLSFCRTAREDGVSSLNHRRWFFVFGALTGDGIRIVVRLFTFMAHDLGRDQWELIVDEGCTVASAVATFRAAYPGLRWPEACLIAVNQEYVATSVVMREGDELAIIPPVSGGLGLRRRAR
jgi:molybdopterin converting factor small subunit